MKLQALKSSAFVLAAGMTFALAGCEEDRRDESAANRAERDNKRVRTVSDNLPPPNRDIKVCGGDLGAACGQNEFCQYPMGQCGNALGDEAGTGNCMKKPDMCAEVDEPVCGCDGKTYGNECKAWIAGASVKAKGACLEKKPTPTPENP